MKRINLNLYENLLVLKVPEGLEKKFSLLVDISRHFKSYVRSWNVCVLPSERNIFHLSKRLMEIREGDGKNETAVFLGRSCRNFFGDKVKNFLVIHGGAVEREGKVLVFVGRHASGKTTIVKGFHSKGWNYLCEDMLMISLDDGKVYPTPPVSLRMGIHSIGNPGRIQAIFMVEYSDRGRTSISPISPHEILLYFIENTLNSQVLDKISFSILVSILKNNPTYRSVHRSWEDVYEFVNDRVIGGGNSSLTRLHHQGLL